MKRRDALLSLGGVLGLPNLDAAGQDTNAPLPGFKSRYKTVLVGAPQPITFDVSVVGVTFRVIEEVNPVMVTDVPPLPAVGWQELAEIGVVSVLNVTLAMPLPPAAHLTPSV